MREADGDLLVLSEPLLRCPTTEVSLGAEVLPMRSSGPTDWPTVTLARASARALTIDSGLRETKKRN